MKDPQFWIFIAGAFAALATGAITIITADKKTKLLAALVCLSAIAQTSMLGIAYFEDTDRPKVVINDVINGFDNITQPSKMLTRYILHNEGEETAKALRNKMEVYLNGELKHTNSSTLPAKLVSGGWGELELLIMGGNFDSAWNKGATLTVNIDLTYYNDDGDKFKMNQSMVFNPNRNLELPPSWTPLDNGADN